MPLENPNMKGCKASSRIALTINEKSHSVRLFPSQISTFRGGKRKGSIKARIVVLALYLFGLQSCATTPGGGSVYEPSGQGRSPAVIVLHTKGGLSGHEKEFAYRLSKQGYVTITVDYFAGDGNNTKHGYEYLTTHPKVDPERIGLVGFSMGAREALDLASRLAISGSDRQISGVVSYYIGNMIVPWIEPLNHPPILFLHGDQDQEVQPIEIINYCKVQKERGTVCDAHVYEGVKHAFDKQSKYGGWDVRATKDAWERTLSFLDKYVKDERN
ncbi:dienelactone hydrolase family protein [Gammaproteobacteria bacterium]|nr:dienelactone hydrolase family protein [Gammaproteobacteria bacterium]